MTTRQIKSLSEEGKPQIMADMREPYENVPIAPEIIKLLRHRQSRVAAGDVKFLDWDQAKSAIGRGSP